MKKFIPLLNIVLVLSMLLAACGPRATEAPTLVPPTPTPEPSGRILSREEAITRLIEEVIEPSSSREWADAYGLPEPLLEGAELWPYLSEESVSISEPTWFFWVDDMPEAMFVHPTRFVFISAESNQLTVLQAQWWPVVNGESLWANVDERLDDPNNVYRGPFAFPDPTLYPREEPETSNWEWPLPVLAVGGQALNWLASYTPKTGTGYAILVGGDKGEALKKTVEAFYEHLKDVEKYDEKNIEKLNPAKSSIDIAKAFDRIKKRIKAGDTLIFFYVGHGSPVSAEIGHKAGIFGPAQGDSFWYGLKTGRAEYRCSIEKEEEVQEWERRLNERRIENDMALTLEVPRDVYKDCKFTLKAKGYWVFTVGKGSKKQEFRIKKVGKKLVGFAMPKEGVNQNSLAYNLRRLPKGVNVIVILDTCLSGSAIDLLKGNIIKAEVFTAADKAGETFFKSDDLSYFTKWMLSKKGKGIEKGNWLKGFNYAKKMSKSRAYKGKSRAYKKDSKPQHEVISADLSKDKVTIYVKIKTDGKPLPLKGAKVTISGKDLTGKQITPISGETNNRVGKFVTKVPRGYAYDIKASYKDDKLDCGSRTIKGSILPSNVSYTVYLTCTKLTKPSKPPEPVQPAPAPEEPTVEPTEEPIEEPTVEPTEEVVTPCIPDAAFVADVTVPDGTPFGPGQCFDKIWRLRNSGDCPWDGYQLAFVSGDQMGAPGAQPVSLTMPGDTVDISMPMCAPEAPGTYRSGWRMRDDSGQVFGSEVYVQIVVAAPVKELVNEGLAQVEQGKTLLAEHATGGCAEGIRLLRLAIEKCSTALEVEPNNAEACFCRGMSRRWLEEELSEAIEDLQCALDKGLEGDKRANAERELAGLRERLTAPLCVSMGPPIFAEKWKWKEGKPTNPGTTFLADSLTEIWARWELSNPCGEEGVVKWYHDGEHVCQHETGKLEGSYDGSGWTADEEWIEPGLWCVAVYIFDTKMTEGCFTIE